MYCYIFAFWVCPWNLYWCLCAVSDYMFHFGQDGTPYVWLRPYNRRKVLHFISNFVCKLTWLLQYLSGETALFSFMLTFLQLQLPKLIIYNYSDSSDTLISHVVVVFYFFFLLFFLLSFSLSLPHFDPDSEAKIVERKSDHLIVIFVVVTDKCHLFIFLLSLTVSWLWKPVTWN